MITPYQKYQLIPTYRATMFVDDCTRVSRFHVDNITHGHAWFGKIIQIGCHFVKDVGEKHVKSIARGINSKLNGADQKSR